MGRVKLEIKKIENITNRQVTFSKRRNGLIKKAHELSVLCDVDVALIMFSPSGRLSLFSGNKRIEEVLERYLSLPEHERGRMNNKEFLQRALGKSRSNYEGHKPFQVSSPTTTDSQIEEVQQQFLQCKSQLEDMERKLRIFESDPGEITTLSEAQDCESILEETLEHVRLRKQALEEAAANEAQADSHPAPQVYFPADDENVIALAAAAANAAGANNDNNNNVVDHYWIQQRDVDTPINILNLTDHPGDVILPLRGEASSHMAEMLSSPTVLLQRQILQQQLDDDNTNNVTTTSPIAMMEEEESNVLDHHQQHFHEFGQHIHDHRHVNLPVPSSWNFHHFYPIGNNLDLTTTAQPTVTTLLELDLSQFTPP